MRCKHSYPKVYKSRYQLLGNHLSYFFVFEMRGLLCFAILVAIFGYNYAAVPSTRIECFRESRIYEAKIKEMIEKLREQLKEGVPEKDIPSLDPFVMKDIRLQLNEEIAKLDWNMTGSIAGLMGFELTQITFSLAGFKFKFGFNFPEIAGKGTYSIDGVLAGVLPVYGGGDFDVLAKNLLIEGSGKLGSSGSGENQTLSLENFTIEVSLEEFKFGVTGLMDDEDLNHLISEMFTDSLPDLIKNFNKQIDTIVSGKVTALANKFLEGKTIQDILDLLKPSSKVIHCGDP